jgi:multiple sugar transport system substrate-binding protein
LEEHGRDAHATIMKYAFLTIFLLLSGFSAVSALTRDRDAAGGSPVLFWMTDINPTRTEQVAAFQRWLAEHRGPPVRVKVDESVAAVTGSGGGGGPDAKIVIQGVSGVLSDIVDVPAQDLGYLQDIGILKDLTGDAGPMGFGPDQTYAAAVPLIEVAGRQYLFPANASANLLFVNKETFRRYGVPVPPRRWTLQQFEETGKRFVAAANPPGTPPSGPGRVFFADRLEPEEVRRSLGLSVFNETLTACTLDDPRNARALRLLRHWAEDLRLLPTQADAASFASGGGYGGVAPQLLRSGQCAMILYSVNLFIQLRQFDRPIDLAASESPNGGFPCMLFRVRGTGIYRASPHADLARHFLSFLASRAYNQNVVDDCDALPPNPRYLRDDRFLRPAGHANEWDVRQAFADASTSIAIPVVVSPFVHYHTAVAVEINAQEAYQSDICSAEEAAARAKRQIDLEIQQTLADEPSLRGRYAMLVGRQAKIDALKREGRPIPLDWIENPFYRRYYEMNGQTVLSAPSADAGLDGDTGVRPVLAARDGEQPSHPDVPSTGRRPVARSDDLGGASAEPLAAGDHP